MISSSTITTNWHIDKKDIRLESLIGEGFFGKVYKATWNFTKVAVKIQKSTINLPTNNPDYNSLITNEFNALINVRHPKLVQFLGIALPKKFLDIDNNNIEEDNDVYLVFEFINFGSLHELLHSGRYTKLNFSQKLQIAIDVGSALCYLHSLKHPTIIHRDLTSSNILLSKHSDNFIEAKVSDFGLSKILSNKDFNSEKTHTYGNLLYLAPESSLRGEYSQKSDVYAYGIILNELFSEHIPYTDLFPNPVVASTNACGEKNARPTLAKKNIPIELTNLIIQCWQRDPELRPEFVKIISVLEKLLVNPQKLSSFNNPYKQNIITSQLNNLYTMSMETSDSTSSEKLNIEYININLSSITSSSESSNLKNLDSQLSSFYSLFVKFLAEYLRIRFRYRLQIPPISFSLPPKHICHASSTCSLYTNPFPNINDFVICEIIDNQFGVVTAKLLEYDQLKGNILLDALSVRKVNPTFELAQIGSRIILQVKKIDFNKKYVDLSRDFISSHEEQLKISDFEHLILVHQILMDISNKFHLCPICTHYHYMWSLISIHPFDAFHRAIVDPSSLFGPFNKCNCTLLKKFRSTPNETSAFDVRLSAYIIDICNSVDADLSSLGLDSFPSEVFVSPSHTFLKSLNIAFNHITKIPDTIGSLSSLNELNCNDCMLSELPRNFQHLKTLQFLYLYNNQFIEFPPVICQIQSLTELTLGRNSLHYVPKEIYLLKQLQKLNLSHNHLTELPFLFSDLVHLESLSLCYNNFFEIPSCIFFLKSLKKLDFEGNTISFIVSYQASDPEIIAKYNESCEGNKKNCKLISLSLNMLTSLEWLNLKNNQLHDFDLSTIPSFLTYLDISNNPILLDISELPTNLKLISGSSSMSPSPLDNIPHTTIEDKLTIHPVSNWSIQEVSSWINSLFPNEPYHNYFEENAINGKALCLLSRDDLKYLGITKLGHIVIILDIISNLVKEESKPNVDKTTENKDDDFSDNVLAEVCDIDKCENIKSSIFLAIMKKEIFTKSVLVRSVVEVRSRDVIDSTKYSQIIDLCIFHLNSIAQEFPRYQQFSNKISVTPILLTDSASPSDSKLLLISVNAFLPMEASNIIKKALFSCNQVFKALNTQLYLCIEPYRSGSDEIQSVVNKMKKKGKFFK